MPKHGRNLNLGLFRTGELQGIRVGNIPESVNQQVFSETGQGMKYEALSERYLGTVPQSQGTAPSGAWWRVSPCSRPHSSDRRSANAPEKVESKLGHEALGPGRDGQGLSKRRQSRGRREGAPQSDGRGDEGGLWRKRWGLSTGGRRAGRARLQVSHTWPGGSEGDAARPRPARVGVRGPGRPARVG